MKKALIISVTVNLLIILGFAGKRLYFHYLTNNNPVAYADQMNNDKNFVLQHLPINKGDIVFVGNSITERLPVELFNSVKVKNRGIGSNLTRHVLARIGPIARAHPAKIFIEVGINDLANNIPLQQVMINFMYIVDTIRTFSPSTQIYIQSVLPTTGSGQALMPGIIRLNKELREFCSAVNATLIDTYSPFSVDGQMSKDLTTDGTHLNYEGYKRYVEVLRGYIESKEQMAAN